MADTRRWTIIAEFEIPSEPGNERTASERIGEIAAHFDVPALRREQLAFAVGEAVLNAIEHGNASRPEIPVRVTVAASADDLAVRVADQGNTNAAIRLERPDLERKLAGLQSPRGWGLFLIDQLVDELRISETGAGHTVELIFHLAPGAQRGRLDDATGGSMVPSNVTMKARPAGEGTAVIDISGEVSSFAEAELMRAYGEAATDGTKTVILNFTDVDYINSSGIGLLVTLLIRADRNGQRLLAYGLGEHYRRIFELTRLNEAIGVLDDEAAALQEAQA